MATLFDMNRGLTKGVKVESTVVSGDPVRVGGLMGVAEIDAWQDEAGDYWSTVAFAGVLTDVNAGLLASGTLNQGDAIYTSTAADANGVGVTAALDTTDTGDLFGYVLNDRTTTGKVEIKVVN